MTDPFDVVVIGAGPGGYAAALYGAAAGLNIALVEKATVGGTCLNRGCIPAKELLEAAAVHRAVASAAEFGIVTSAPSVDAARLFARKTEVVDKLVGGVSGLLKNRKVTVLEGTARLGPDHVVAVTGGDGSTTDVVGTNVILAAGSVPRTIPGFEIDGGVVLTSDDVFELDHLPDRVVIIGGGVIGCEFASMLCDLGADVTLLEALPGLLLAADPDVVRPLQRSLAKRGVKISTGVRVNGHTPGTTGTTVHVEGGDDIETDMVIVATGRRPMSDDLVDASTGVVVDGHGFVEVDDHCRTAADGVYAVGDVIATPGLAHIGFAEAMLVVKQILGERAVPIDYSGVPWCVYTQPEVAWAGLTEQAAKDAGYDVVVSKHPWGGTSRALIIGETEGTVKVVAQKRPDGSPGRILGVHLSGPWVTEQLGAGYFSVNWEATVDDVASLIQPHPTLSENFGETVLALTGRGLHT
ncbi:MAG: dihydrolipoyl dehydrogenase [Actinobacteria bacterium]|nr:dihydrolipoyl dehydrogenase [Actinomycetota bacterium]